MKQHKYQISVKHLVDPKGQPSTYTEDLVFTAYNHDDIFKVLEKLQQKKIIDEEKSNKTKILQKIGDKVFNNKTQRERVTIIAIGINQVIKLFVRNIFVDAITFAIK